MRRLSVVLVLVMVLAGTVVSAEKEGPLNVAIIWHQHQPLYKDPAAGIYQLPWVRMHAIKDYYDMVSILEEYPKIHLTFNLVPSLLYQLDDYARNGAKDTYMIVAEKHPKDLSRDEKIFLLTRFFDANWDNIIQRYPRYWELLKKRGTSGSIEEAEAALARFTEQDLRDLQVWFNLAWFDPDFLEDDPELRSLVSKGMGFTEEDKEVLFSKQLEITRKVVGIHRKFQDEGRIEITTTPYYHPILPLLFDTDLARIASPSLNLPPERFSYPQDVRAQLAKAVQSYLLHFKRPPKGLWPSEQAVSESIVPLVADAGFEWMISSEGVLQKSLGVQLRDETGRVVRPELLYQPYIVEKDEKQVQIVFRDILLSDKVGFSYSGMSGTAAALDLVNYLRDVKDRLGAEASQKVVVIALDGENAWEYYENDGKEFFHTLYELLSQEPGLRTVTIDEYLTEHPATAKIDVLHTGSWIGDHLETWIGEPEENKAWAYLLEARRALGEFTEVYGDDYGKMDVLRKAWEEMYASEGSDWLWWYGSDQDSGNDAAFDRLFRTHLMNIYRIIGKPVPEYLSVPIISQEPALPLKDMSGMLTADIDGAMGRGEWNSAALFMAQDSGIKDGQHIIKALRVGVDADKVYLRVDLTDRNLKPVLTVYFDANQARSNAVTRFSVKGEGATYLGFGPGIEVLADLATASNGKVRAVLSRADGASGWIEEKELESALGMVYELAIPFEDLGLKPGQALNLAVTAALGNRDVDKLPVEGPVNLRVPEPVTGEVVFAVEDEEGDDKGPGTYSYPTNPVFGSGVFDMTGFRVLDGGEEVIFEVSLRGEIENVWNSPIGLSVQTIDIYIDTDRKPNSGKAETLGGRRVEMEPGSAWEYAIWVEGWNQKVFTADGKEAGGVRVTVDPIESTVAIRVPKDSIGQPEPSWGYQVFVLGQEGYPSPDSLRVREVMKEAAEWRFGGGSDGEFDPNVIDMLVPKGRNQAEILGSWDEGSGLAKVPAVYHD